MATDEGIFVTWKVSSVLDLPKAKAMVQRLKENGNLIRGCSYCVNVSPLNLCPICENLGAKPECKCVCQSTHSQECARRKRLGSMFCHCECHNVAVVRRAIK